MKWLTENFSIKILSLGVALIIWIFISNVTNPMVSGFVSVPVTFENENYILEQNKTYAVVDSRVVKVTYLVKSNAQTHVRQSDFKVTVDLKDLETTNKLPVRVTPLNNIDNDISNILPDPQYLHVELQNISRNEFPVEYEIKGDAGPGHSVGSVILSPNVVYISGSNVAVENIGKASIEIPLSNNEEAFSGIAKVKVYDKNGAVLSNDGLALSAEDINYFVVINTRANVTLNAVVEGNVKPGFVYAGVQVVPSNIMISGPRSAVQNQYVIDLPTINIEGLESNTEYTYKVSDILPKGITANVDTIKVNVTINPNPFPGPHLEIRSPGETSAKVISMPTTAPNDETESIEEEVEEEVVTGGKSIESSGVAYATGSVVE